MNVGDTGCQRTVSAFSQEDQALRGIEVSRPESEGAIAAAHGLGVQPQQKGVQSWVVAGGGRGVVDLGQPVARDRAARRRQPRGFGDPASWIVSRCDEAIVFGVPVQAAQGRNKVLARAAPTAGVAAGNNVGPDVLDEVFDLRGCRLVQRRCPQRSRIRFQYQV
ncbi:hypothetical protein [Amycolatopsis arida]|uniref:hypothetical protein n=1 Tax=Amycolatopsis arida TaxID=587909 RepID=UPI0015A64552